MSVEYCYPFWLLRELNINYPAHFADDIQGKVIYNGNVLASIIADIGYPACNALRIFQYAVGIGRRCAF